MPKVINDTMVNLNNNDKLMIRRIGYRECADLLCKSEGYIRYLTSKGEKRMRESELEMLRRVE